MKKIFCPKVKNKIQKLKIKADNVELVSEGIPTTIIVDELKVERKNNKHKSNHSNNFFNKRKNKTNKKEMAVIDEQQGEDGSLIFKN